MPPPDTIRMFERTYEVPVEYHTERLDRFLEQMLPDVSRLRLRRCIQAGEVTVDGTVRESGRRIYEGQIVRLSTMEEPAGTMAPEALPIQILHEDETLLIVDKPAGMLAHPTSKVHSGTLLNAAVYHLNRESCGRRVRPLLVHRLDRATSGLLVLSKEAKAHEALARAWNQKRVNKWYEALVCGSMPDPEGVIDAPIGGARNRMPGYAVDSAGRPAQTRYWCQRRYGPFTLMRLQPLTGRTNQLRIHCAFAGAAIAGEDLHGLPELKLFSHMHSDAIQPSRLFLHASRLEFEHPLTRQPFEIESPLPEELRKFLEKLVHQYGVEIA